MGMQFFFVSTVTPIVLFIGLPWLLKTGAYRWLLALACGVFMVSWLLPSPLIDGQQTEFVTHFVGGGIFCGLLGLYLKLALRWKAVWYIELAALFALVSSLGVLNELFEVFLYTQGLMPNGISDTSWDLVANTLGASLFYLLYKLISPK